MERSRITPTSCHMSAFRVANVQFDVFRNFSNHFPSRRGDTQNFRAGVQRRAIRPNRNDHLTCFLRCVTSFFVATIRDWFDFVIENHPLDVVSRAGLARQPARGEYAKDLVVELRRWKLRQIFIRKGNERAKLHRHRHSPERSIDFRVDKTPSSYAILRNSSHTNSWNWKSNHFYTYQFN